MASLWGSSVPVVFDNLVIVASRMSKQRHQSVKKPSRSVHVSAGIQAGKFVSYECEGGKRLQARLAADGSTVRIRHEGGYELDRKGNGVYEGEGWRLETQGKVELHHHGKPVARACRAV